MMILHIVLCRRQIILYAVQCSTTCNAVQHAGSASDESWKSPVLQTMIVRVWKLRLYIYELSEYFLEKFLSKHHMLTSVYLTLADITDNQDIPGI